jgi:hypothetical protein
MIRKSEILDGIRIATPCHASWDAMDGDERVRFCGACRLNVYNISEMSRGEAEELVQKTEGRLCIRMYQRTDGTVITRDCPVGVRALRKRLVVAATCVCALFLTVSAFATSLGQPPADDDSSLWQRMKVRVHQVEPFKSFFAWLDPPAHATTGAPMMGNSVRVMGRPAMPITISNTVPTPINSPLGK